MPRRRSVLALVVAAGMLGACSSMLGPRTVEVSESQLQQHLARRFPYSHRYLELFDVTVASPRIALLPDTNRVATELDISATERLLRTPFSGSMSLNCGLRFEPRDNSIRMVDVRVDRFVIDSAPGVLRSQSSRLGALLAEEMLKDQAIHTLRPDEVERVQARGYRPGALKVTPRGIELTLEPVQ